MQTTSIIIKCDTILWILNVLKRMKWVGVSGIESQIIMKYFNIIDHLSSFILFTSSNKMKVETFHSSRSMFGPQFFSLIHFIKQPKRFIPTVHLYWLSSSKWSIKVLSNSVKATKSAKFHSTRIDKKLIMPFNSKNKPAKRS